LIDASDNGRLFRGIFAVKENGFATTTKLLHGLVPVKQPHGIATGGVAAGTRANSALPEG
jgi:hypothetical protein